MAPQSIYLLLGFIAYASSRPQPSVLSSPTFTGVATFNNYANQGNTVCGPKTASNPLYYGAAAGDISPNISGGHCAGSIDPGLCTQGQSPASDYAGPACPTTNCGVCYQVTSMGPYGSGATAPDPGARSIIVQIIDSCPSTNAWNYCKTQVPSDERCGSAGTNSLDIDLGAYVALTGLAWDVSRSGGGFLSEMWADALGCAEFAESGYRDPGRRVLSGELLALLSVPAWREPPPSARAAVGGECMVE
ncbi:hypothetical protein MMC26_007776 [Xylographa opegraphella]|nr:hypothetical protein [Xylographa opegraphella]